MDSIGKVIIAVGVVLIIFGLFIHFGGKIGLGKLPGDIFIDKGNFKFFFPITSSIIISIILSLLLRLFKK